MNQEAENTRICQVRDRVHDPLQRFDGGGSEVLPYALAN
jgi:hypothetical protein